LEHLWAIRALFPSLDDLKNSVASALRTNSSTVDVNLLLLLQRAQKFWLQQKTSLRTLSHATHPKNYTHSNIRVQAQKKVTSDKRRQEKEREISNHVLKSPNLKK
jgi:hypothetical protein